jgi:alkylation response protein AidB-like acyl-CoA dehydrogenase
MDGNPASSSGSRLIERARDAAELLKAAGDRIETEREIPKEVLAALHEAGLFRLTLPRSLGGAECDLATLAEITQIIAAADASTAWCIGQGSGCAMSASFLDPAVAKRLFGPANAVLAWGAGVQGTMVEVPGGYRASGRWSFASGSRHATLLGAHCKVIGPDGKPRLRPDGRPADRTAFLARSKAQIDDVWQVVGLKGTGSDSYDVENLFVPAEETIDREALEGVIAPGTLYRFSTMQVYQAAFGGVMLGISRGMLDDRRRSPAPRPRAGRPAPCATARCSTASLGNWRRAGARFAPIT